MKKLVMILALLICATSCVPNYKDQEVMERPDNAGRRFRFNEHDYISFSSGNSTNSIVHDPDCRKCSKKEDE